MVSDLFGDDPGLVSRLLAEGAASWPTAVVAAEAYAAHLRARLPPGRRLADLHTRDLYLACACMHGDEAAIHALDETFLCPLPRLLARRGVARDLADEVVQGLRERLLVAAEGDRRPAIGDYDGRGALAAWLRVAAARSAAKWRRDEGNRRALLVADANDAASSPLSPIDPALATMKRRYGLEFERAIRDAFAALDEMERHALRLHFVDGLDLDAIGRVLGVSRATAGRRVLAGRQEVHRATVRLLEERLGATPTELASLLVFVRSTLDVSLAALGP